MELPEFVSRLDNVNEMPSGISARCPAHDDAKSSLMVNQGDHGGIVLKCHAGCKTLDVLAAMGLSAKDVQGQSFIEASYEYTDAGGSPLWVVQRWANPKTFRCVPKLPPPGKRVIYELPAVRYAATAGITVYVVEGEKDVHTLMSASLIATTNVGGAGSWLAHYGEMFRNCNVVVIADNDPPGKAHARKVAENIRPHAASVELRVPQYGKDVTEMIEKGYGLETMLALSDVEDIGILASDITPRAIEWLWEGHLPLGKLVIFEGDPGDGKSLATLDLAARVSRGGTMPDGSVGLPPRVVILVSAEDDPEDTLHQRLTAAGANLRNIIVVPHGSSPGEPFEFASDLGAVERKAKDLRAALIVFDPLMAFLGDKTDTHSDHSVRRALRPLQILAAETRALVVAVRHFNKAGTGTKAIYKGGGSIAFTGAARAVFLIAPHFEKPDLKVFACVKHNLARKPVPLTYLIEINPDGVPYIAWVGQLNTTAQEVLDGPTDLRDGRREEAQTKRRVREYEKAFLKDMLADAPMAWEDIVQAGKSDGFGEHALRNARSELGLRKVFGTHGNSDVKWALPALTDFESDDDSDASDSQVSDPTFPLGDQSKWQPATTTGSQVGKWEAEESGEDFSDSTLHPDGTTDADRDLQLLELPLVCSKCNSEDEVHRWFKPYWVIRCWEHPPTGDV